MTLTLREMAERLKQLKSATIFCHMRPDGDTLGAAMGLKCMLESCGARCSVVCESKIPDKFLFLEGMGEISRTPNGNAEAYIAVDSSEIHRLGFLGDAFERAKKPKFNIDHHISNSRYGDYCYVEDRAATCEIMTELSSTIILYRPPYVTMPVVIFENTMSSGADFGIAASMGVLLMVFVYVPLLLVNKVTRVKAEV